MLITHYELVLIITSHNVTIFISNDSYLVVTISSLYMTSGLSMTWHMNCQKSTFKLAQVCKTKPLY